MTLQNRKVIVTTEYAANSGKKATTQEALFLGFGSMVDEYSESNQVITGAIIELEDGSVFVEYLRYIKFKKD